MLLMRWRHGIRPTTCGSISPSGKKSDCLSVCRRKKFDQSYNLCCSEFHDRLVGWLVSVYRRFQHCWMAKAYRENCSSCKREMCPKTLTVKPDLERWTSVSNVYSSKPIWFEIYIVRTHTYTHKDTHGQTHTQTEYSISTIKVARSLVDLM